MNSTEPATAAGDLENITHRLAAAVAEEECLIVEVATQERAAETALADAYLADKELPATKNLDVARSRLIAVRAALSRLRVMRDKSEADGIASRVDEVLAEVRKTRAERMSAYRCALAVQVLAARLMSMSTGSAGGNYELCGRLNDNGLLIDGDLPTAENNQKLRSCSIRLQRLGMTETDTVCQPSPRDLPGGQMLRNNPLVGEVRRLVAELEEKLGDLLPQGLPRFIAETVVKAPVAAPLEEAVS